MAKSLTNRQIEKAWMNPELGDKTLYLEASEPGLFVEIRRGELPRWVMIDSKHGAPRRPLGPWPDTSIAAATQEARRLIAVRLNGAAWQSSIGDALALYWEGRLSMMRAGSTTRRSLRLALRELMDRPVGMVTTEELETIIHETALDAETHANRTLAYLKSFFRWCLSNGLADSNPARAIPAPCAETPRDRRLTLHELTEIWWATDALCLEYKLAVRLLMLTATRRDQVAMLQVFDLQPLAAQGFLWNLPTRDGPPLMIELRYDAEHVINEALAYQKPCTDLLFSTNGRSRLNGWSKVKDTIDNAIMQRRVRRRGDAATPMPAWVLNDFRATFLDLGQEELDEDPLVLKRCLGLTSPFLGAYREWAYSPHMDGERHRALGRWMLLIRHAREESVR